MINPIPPTGFARQRRRWQAERAVTERKRSAVADQSLWGDVDRLVDRVGDLQRLRFHRLHLLAHRRRRALGEEVPPELEQEAMTANAVALLAPLVLAEIRTAYPGRIVVLKGPEAAASYPDPASRPYGDVDVLVDDVPAAQQALLRAGFHEIGDPRVYQGIHHVRPLVKPQLPIRVELHARPKWVPWVAAPDAASLLGSAVPSATGVDGVLALPPAQHAIVIAVHSWAHEPLRRALELIDAAAVAAHADAEETASLARSWGVERIWLTTGAASRAMLGRERSSALLRLWAGSVLEVREPTVLESHVGKWLSPYAARSPARAVAATPGVLLSELRRDEGDTWRRKLRRSREALRNASKSRRAHEELMEQLGVNAPGREVKRSP